MGSDPHRDACSSHRANCRQVTWRNSIQRDYEAEHALPSRSIHDLGYWLFIIHFRARGNQSMGTDPLGARLIRVLIRDDKDTLRFASTTARGEVRPLRVSPTLQARPLNRGTKLTGSRISGV